MYYSGKQNEFREWWMFNFTKLPENLSITKVYFLSLFLKIIFKLLVGTAMAYFLASAFVVPTFNHRQPVFSIRLHNASQSLGNSSLFFSFFFCKWNNLFRYNVLFSHSCSRITYFFLYLKCKCFFLCYRRLTILNFYFHGSNFYFWYSLVLALWHNLWTSVSF